LTKQKDGRYLKEPGRKEVRIMNQRIQGVSTERGDYKLSYEGKLHQIDSNTLINSLFNITAAIQEINAELNKESNIKTTLQIKINAFSGGSFLVNLQLLRDIAKDLFPPAVFVGAQIDIKTIINVLIQFIKLKLSLKGGKPQEIHKNGDEVKITNNEGDITIIDKRTYNLYKGNVIVNESITKNFETLREDDAIDGFKLTDKKDRPLIDIHKEDFNNLIPRNELLEEKTKILTSPKASLYIIKLVFEENYKWQFYYEGNKISATMEDKTFLSKIDAGEKFSKGDTLVCNLEIEQIFDENVNTYVNKAYKILKVLEHKPRPEQTDLLPSR
jgi:hypothetical protein